MLSHSKSPPHLELEVDIDVCVHRTHFSPTVSIQRKPEGKAITMATKLLHHWSQGKGDCLLGEEWRGAVESPILRTLIEGSVVTSGLEKGTDWLPGRAKASHGTDWVFRNTSRYCCVGEGGKEYGGVKRLRAEVTSLPVHAGAPVLHSSLLYNLGLPSARKHQPYRMKTGILCVLRKTALEMRMVNVCVCACAHTHIERLWNHVAKAP